MRFANGIPTIFDSEGAHHFPLDGPTVFTLENISGHQVYNNDPANQRKLREQENADCDVILVADRKKLFDEMLDQGYAPDQIGRILAHWDSGDEAYDETPALAKDGQHRHGATKARGVKIRRLGEDK